MVTYPPKTSGGAIVVCWSSLTMSEVFTDIQVKGTASFSLQREVKWEFG
jgi:hypothetical protein